MKYLSILFTFLTINLIAQEKNLNQDTLNFDKKFIDCQNKWVAFKPKENNSYDFGFVYFDPQAGLSLNYEGSFSMKPSGKYVPQKMDKSMIKIRLKPNNMKVALIPKDKYSDLGIKVEPDWLKFYKTDTTSIQSLYKKGFLYNAWNECEKALPFLLKANQKDPNYKGLNVEIAFSYNCLNQFEKAIQYLEKALKHSPKDAFVNKEYIYTLCSIGNIDKAIEQYETSKKIIDNQLYEGENCFNILKYFYDKKDKTNFNIWYEKIKNLPKVTNSVSYYVENMKKSLIK